MDKGSYQRAREPCEVWLQWTMMDDPWALTPSRVNTPNGRHYDLLSYLPPTLTTYLPTYRPNKLPYLLSTSFPTYPNDCLHYLSPPLPNLPTFSS